MMPRDGYMMSENSNLYDGYLDKGLHDFCRAKVSTYWLGYLLPKQQYRLWLLFCYCFRAIDDLTDVLPPKKARREFRRLDHVIKCAIAGTPISPESDVEKYLYGLFCLAKHDKFITSYLLRAYSAQKEDSTRSIFISAKKLARIKRGKAIALVKLFVYLTDPSRSQAKIEKLGRKVGTYGQWIDDIIDLEEDFRMKKSTITREDVKKYKIRTIDDIYDSDYVRNVLDKVIKLRYSSLREIKKIDGLLTKLFLLSFFIRFDPGAFRLGKNWRAKQDYNKSNILKKMATLMGAVYPQNYFLGHLLAYLLGMPVLAAIIAYKGYSKYLL